MKKSLRCSMALEHPHSNPSVSGRPETLSVHNARDVRKAEAEQLPFHNRTSGYRRLSIGERVHMKE